MTNERPGKLKIAIAVHGRFEAFDLTRELLKRGHDVTLLTNYPKYVVRRFGLRSATRLPRPIKCGPSIS